MSNWNARLHLTRATSIVAAGALGFATLLPSVGCRSTPGLMPTIAPGFSQSMSMNGGQNMGMNTNMNRAMGAAQQSQVNAPPLREPTTFQSHPTLEQEYNLHMELGRNYESQNSFETAAVEFQQALEICNRPTKFLQTSGKLSPEQKGLAHRKLAASLDRLGMFPQAEGQYREAMALNARDPQLWNDLGYSYYLQRRFPEAEQALRNALLLAPTDSKAMTNLGLALASQGKTANAYQMLAQVNGPAIAHANLGFLMSSMGRTDLARQHYQAAIQLQPAYEPFQTALAELETDIAAKAAQSNPALPIPNPAALAYLPPIAAPGPGLPPSTAAITPPTPIASNRDFSQDTNVSRAANTTGIPIPKPLDLTPHAN